MALSVFKLYVVDEIALVYGVDANTTHVEASVYCPIS